ncbi:MAG: glycosyltransferase, partial [Holophagae bacterium]|nr:glycosyltransferase [Holophagae bacterium]
PPVDYEVEAVEPYPLSDGFNICFAHTYAGDEPYDIVMEAVERVSDVYLYVTGNREKSTHPLWNFPRVVHTGFLKRSQYLGLLTGSDAVMTLTTRDNTMQKAGNEAIFLGQPLITSDLTFLRQYFQKGTVYVSLTVDGIEAGIREMKERHRRLTEEMRRFAQELKETNRARVLAIPLQVMNGEEAE